jgi:hypothetical protein
MMNWLGKNTKTEKSENKKIDNQGVAKNQKSKN